LVDEIRDRLMTNNNVSHLEGTEHALDLLQAQFLTTWLNISANFQSPDMIVHLDRITGSKLDPVQLYGATELPLSEIIRITEEKITEYKQFGTGWGEAEFITAEAVFAAVNEAENNTGYVFRPAPAN
jgi:hypothetical protein